MDFILDTVKERAGYIPSTTTATTAIAITFFNILNMMNTFDRKNTDDDHLNKMYERMRKTRRREEGVLVIKTESFSSDSDEEIKCVLKSNKDDDYLRLVQRPVVPSKESFGD